MPLLRRKDYVALLIGDVAVFAVSLWLTLWLRNLSPPGWTEFEVLLAPFAVLFAIYLARDVLQMQLVEIGQAFGGRDHSTVIHSVDKVQRQMSRDRTFRDRIESARSELVAQ